MFVLAASALSAGFGYAAAGLEPSPPVTPRLATSRLAATPGILDRSCAGGRGVKLPPPPGGEPVVAQMRADGVTVVGIALQNYSGKDASILLQAYTPTCSLDSSFGTGGSELVSLPGQLKWESMNDVAAPGLSDSVILAAWAGHSDRSAIAIIGPNGGLDRHFASGG